MIMYVDMVTCTVCTLCTYIVNALYITLQAPKHLVKFVTFHDHDLYLGINFKKVLHSPSQYCFCLKVSAF